VPSAVLWAGFWLFPGWPGFRVCCSTGMWGGAWTWPNRGGSRLGG
jgi:hypothetical protein